MSYTPINWQTGDTITAEKLNKMDNGWSVETTGGELFSETVTTEKDPSYPEDPAWGEFEYTTKITADLVTVTFNGNEYECALITDGYDSNYYGGWVEDGGDFIPDFSVYPFGIVSETGYVGICTETGGTYTVKVDATTSTLEVSNDFSKAVNACVDVSTMPLLCVSGTTTRSEMERAYGEGKSLYFHPYQQVRATYYIVGFTSTVVSFFPEVTGVTATFENDVFTVIASV